jgi:RNA polymerase sigma factor (TIGR02999 family)
MSEATTQDTITGLLQAIERGDRTALESLFPLVYEELRILARRQRQAWHGNLTLNTTALVHEAYLKLVHQGRIGVTSRAHFFAVAATAMRHILCNYARDRQRQKRGGDVQHVSLDNVDHAPIHIGLSDEAADLLAELDTALVRLEQLDKRQSRIVECRFFGGLSVEETAAALGISPATVKRDWTLARAWLYREMHLPPGAEGLSIP